MIGKRPERRKAFLRVERALRNRHRGRGDREEARVAAGERVNHPVPAQLISRFVTGADAFHLIGAHPPARNS